MHFLTKWCQAATEKCNINDHIGWKLKHNDTISDMSLAVGVLRLREHFHSF